MTPAVGGNGAGLTDTGNEVVEAFLGEQRVLQATEVELQHAGHRVDVVVAFLVNQRVVTCMGGGGKRGSTMSWQVM